MSHDNEVFEFTNMFCLRVYNLYFWPSSSKRFLMTYLILIFKRYIINLHNNHSRTQKNLHAVNAWAGIVGRNLIDPCLLPNRLEAIRIIILFIITVLTNLLEDVYVITRSCVCLMHDGEPPHFTWNVHEFLNQTHSVVG